MPGMQEGDHRQPRGREAHDPGEGITVEKLLKHKQAFMLGEKKEFCNFVGGFRAA